MPQWAPQPAKWGRLVAYVVLACFIGGYASLVWHWPFLTILATAVVVAATTIVNRRHRRRLARLAESRPDESICTFVRALPIRELDTWVVRATFESLRQHLRGMHDAFPLRPSDLLVHDLRMDPEDLEDLVIEIAGRAGRNLKGAKANPYFDRVVTVEDLINFLCAQPRDLPKLAAEATDERENHWP